MNTPLSPLHRVLLPAVPVLFLFAACAPKYYAGNAQNVPLLGGKGDAAVAASVNPDGSRADARGAVAITKNLALQANAALYFPRDTDSGDGGSGGLFELGAGYFRPLPRNFVFETYGLAAYGGVENHFPTSISNNPGTTGKLNASLVRIAVQPALGYKLRYLEAAASTRLAMLNYFNVGGSLVAGGEDQQRSLRDNRVQFLVEPAVTVRGGLPTVKAEVQVGWSVNLTDGDFPQDDSWASLGLVYFFDPLR